MAQKHAQPASKVIGPEKAPEAPTVIFYRLGRKFVDDEREIPQESADVMYYTLAVGHHTGIMDCFDAKLSCPVEMFERIVALFDEDGQARYKLAGIIRSGEIQVDKSHVGVLDAAVDEACKKAAAEGADREGERVWLEGFAEMLDAVKRDSAVYLIGRLRA